MAITMDEQAILQTRQFQQEHEEWRSLFLRLYLAGKGCDGFSYGVSFDDAKEEDLHIRQEASDGQLVELIVDPDTFRFVKGARITWVDDERGRGYLVENPRHKSFRGKFFKRKGWEERLQPTSTVKRNGGAGS